MLDCLDLGLKSVKQLQAKSRAFIRSLAVFAAVLASGTASAEGWTTKKVDRLPEAVERPLAPEGLPDGEVAILENAEVFAAWYTKPTTRYAHGILGDAIEAGELTVETSTGETLTYTLPENQVFEDRTPRLVDLDGFGKTQIITILSDQTKGGSIAVFGVRKGKLELVAQTPYIGRSNRWLNIAGIDDFDGDGKTQIAAVWTPHIGGTLKYWTWDKGKLRLSGEAYGFSNHFIGSREQELSTVNDFNGNGVSDLALPSADRKSVRIMTFKGPARGKKVLEEFARIPMPARVDKAMSSRFENGKVTITVGLEDGSVHEISH
jgi:hypothetical protein